MTSNPWWWIGTLLGHSSLTLSGLKDKYIWVSSAEERYDIPLKQLMVGRCRAVVLNLGSIEPQGFAESLSGVRQGSRHTHYSLVHTTLSVTQNKFSPLVLVVTPRSAWPSLAAADHATLLGFDICAAGNLVVDLWLLWLYVICDFLLIFQSDLNQILDSSFCKDFFCHCEPLFLYYVMLDLFYSRLWFMPLEVKELAAGHESQCSFLLCWFPYLTTWDCFFCYI